MIRFLALLTVIFLTQSIYSQCTDLNTQFTVNQNQFCGSGIHSVILTNTSSGINNTVSTYDWFLNGSLVSSTNGLSAPPNINLTTVGNYTIELVGTDTIPCTESFSLQVEVLPVPVSSFTISPDGECAGTTISFNNTSTNTVAATTYNWNFGDGNTSNSENPNHSFTSGGNYTVILTVNNGAGCTNSYSTTVNALNIPLNSGIIGDDGDGNLINCLLPGNPTTSQTVSFLNNTTGAASYTWNFGDGNTSTDPNPSHLYTTFGTFPVIMTATGLNGCTITETVSVVFEKFVSASLVLDVTEYSGCVPLTLSTLTNNSINANSFVWDFGDGSAPYTSTTITPPNHIYTQAGNYSISLSASNSCNTANTTIGTIVVVDKPQVNFALTGNTGCAPAAIGFTNSTTGASPANAFTWDMGNGNTYNTTVTPPIQAYDTAGVYTVSLTASNACGDSTLTQTIALDTIPLASFDLLPDEGCSPLTVDINNTSTGNITQYRWSRTGFGFSYGPTYGPFTYTYTPGNSPVTQNVTLRVLNACGSTTVTQPIIIHRPTRAQFSTSSTTVCLGGDFTYTNQSLGENLTYEWDFGDGSTSTAVGPHTINYATPGTYDVRLIAKGYCGNDTMIRTVIVHPLTVADIIPLDPIEGCSPMDVSFQNNSTGANLTYQWRIDGAYIGNSTNIGPINFTETPGNTPVNHTIQLRVNSACGVQTTETIVIVHRPTEAQMTVSSNEVCLGESITASQTSLGENLTYEWDFGDGSTSTTAGPHTINYAAPGTYDIRLIAKGYCGNDTITETVTVHPLTVADMIPLDPIEGCSPMDISFQNNSTGANLTYEWRLDGTLIGSSTDIGPINFTETPGNAPVNHTIQLRVNSACGVQTTETIVIVHRPTEAQMSVSPTEVCLGESFTATQTSLGENLTYEWDFGDGSTSTTAGPHTIDYSAAGTYDIQLVALGYCGNDTVRTSVTVHPFPIADFSPDLPNGCEDLEMTFTNNSTPTALQSWNFGPNASPAISTNFDPGTINFPDAGIEEIVLIVEENGCVSSDTNYIEVFPLPVLDFTLVPDEGCSDLEVQINNTSVDNGGETFTWNLGNGNTFTGYSPLDQTYIAINNDSIYDIQLIVTSGVGCEDSLTRQLIVHPVPVADFDFDLNPICQNTDAVFINNSTVGMAYEWDFGDGNTSNAFNPTHQYANDGTYTVRLVVNSPFTCSDTIFKDILVHPTAVPLFSATTACFGYETAFTDQSTGNVASWNWTFGDGGTSTDQNPSHLYPSAGNYSADLSVTTNFGCVTNLTLPVAVNEIPVADFSSVNFCHGDATAFTNLTSGATIGVEWDFADGSALNTMNNPSHTYTTVGDFDVRLVAFGGSGCSDTIIQTVTINPVPTADFSYLTVCAEDATFFTDISGGNPDNYAWDFGNGTFDNTNNPNPEIVYLNDGTYTVSLTVDYTATGCSNSISYNVDAHPRTTPQFTATTACFETETAFTDASLNNPVLWEWDFGDASPLNTAQNPTHLYTAPGTYNVELVTENIFGCSDTIIQSIVVNVLPTAGFDFDTVCLNAATSFTDLSTDAITWEYSFGDGNIANTNSPNHVFLNDGNHIVQQVVTNILGCTDTIIETIIVRPNPTAIFSTDIACFSYPTTFTNNSIDAVASQWIFDDLGVTNNTNSPTYIYSVDGTFNPELVVENIYGCTDTITESALVLPQPVADFSNTTVCARDVVSFTNTSLGTPTRYEWTFDDGSGTFTTEDVTHTFTNGGIYDVTLIVENAAGCSDTLIEPIEVYTVPNVSFSADTVCLFNITHFTDLSNDLTPISTWDWDFGDGNTSPDQNPTYIYQNSGVFDVFLTVTNINGCDSTFSDQVLVSLVPQADFDFVSDCFGAPTIFTDLSTNNPGIYLWDFGDGTTLNGGPNEQHTYTSPGIYIVELQVLGSDSVCSDSKIKVVSVADGAQADFLIPAHVCVNDVFNFYDNSSASIGTIVSYEWTMSDGTIYNTANGTHTFNAPGVHQVTVNITTSDGCQATHTESIEVLPSTTADFEWGSTCSNTVTQFTNTSTGGTTNWFWNFGDGTTSQTQFPTHVYTAEGDYSVMLIVQNLSGCADTIIQTVTIDPSPVINFTNDEVCFGDLTTFTNQTTITSGNVNTYEWIFGNNEGNSSQVDPQYEFTTYAQNHLVTLIATSDKGCTDTITKPVNLLPIVDFNIDLGDQFGCAPITVFFDNQSEINGATILNYLWDFGDGNTSFQQSPTHTFLEEGSYPVSLTVFTSTDCQIIATDGLNLEVFPSPVAAFDVNPPITSVSEAFIKITDESQGASFWEYDLGNGNYSNSANLSHNFNEVGSYFITQFVQNEYGCTDSTQRAIEIQEDFTLYVPNAFTPDDGNKTNDYFTWEVSGFDTFEMRVFNRWGELIFETKDPDGQWDGRHNDQKIRDGVYVWQVKAMDLNGDERIITGHVSALK